MMPNIRSVKREIFECLAKMSPKKNSFISDELQNCNIKINENRDKAAKCESRLVDQFKSKTCENEVEAGNKELTEKLNSLQMITGANSFEGLKIISLQKKSGEADSSFNALNFSFVNFQVKEKSVVDLKTKIDIYQFNCEENRSNSESLMEDFNEEVEENLPEIAGYWDNTYNTNNRNVVLIRQIDHLLDVPFPTRLF